MSIRALIIDDEVLARRRLRRLLEAHPDVETAGEAADGEAAYAATLSERPDLIFLDVNMPGADGLSALERIREALPESQRPLVVFTTAYEEHAVRAFELEGLDYLLKPVEADTLARALRRARRALGERGVSPAAARPAGEDAASAAIADAPTAAATADAPPAAEPEAAPGKPLRHLAAVRGGKILSLSLERVACVTVEDTITYAHTPEGRFRLKPTLGELETRLPAPGWQRISRSALVNLDWIASLEPMFSGSYLAKLKAPLGTELQVSRRRARALRELLGW